MITLITLLFMPNLETIKIPIYSSGHCYSDGSRIIKIYNVLEKSYTYSQYVLNDRGLLNTPYLQNSFNTIETVYTKEVVCP